MATHGTIKKDHFMWFGVAQEAFLQLKTAITSATVFASGVKVGAVLSQHNYPIAYFSKKLSSRMQKHLAYTHELLAIIEAMSKFKHYLLGHKFITRTDQQALKYLCNQAIQTPEQQRLLPKLLGYDFEIEYNPGVENLASDALLRCFFFALRSRRGNLVDRDGDSGDRRSEGSYSRPHIPE